MSGSERLRYVDAWDLYRWRIRDLLFRGRWWWAFKSVLWLRSELSWERRLGVRTVIGGEEFDPDKETLYYEGVGYASAARILQQIAPSSPDSGEVFLDAGCGLGRMLVLAARHPYACVRGFDYNRDLVAGAQDNLDRVRGTSACGTLEAGWGDAASYHFADDVTTLFVFNSFRGAVMDGFMEALRQSLLRRSRPFKLLFANPMFFDATRHPWLVSVREWHEFNPNCRESSGLRMRSVLFEVDPELLTRPVRDAATGSGTTP